MKIFTRIIPLVAAFSFAASAVQADDELDLVVCNRDDTSNYLQELDERDWDSLYDYINTKRTINVNEKACNLTISGDVRVDWRSIYETENGKSVRGHVLNSKGYPIGHNDFDAEFNLRFDYVCDRAWAVAHLQFDNSAGIAKDHPCSDIVRDGKVVAYKACEGIFGSGSGCDIDLKKAYLGYNICCDGCTRFDIELGRRRLYQVFDSEVQYLSRFDGVLFKYDSCFDCVGDWYVHLAGFIVDYTVNHYAWIVETGLYDIMNSNFDLKYSFIDWRKNGKNRCGVQNPYGSKFMNSQYTVHYNIQPEYLWCVPGKLFAALVWNHDAEPFRIPKEEVVVENDVEETVTVYHDYGKQNLAWYAGFTLGEVVYAGDWSFNLQYQWVQARAIPDEDVSGIGRGNINKSTVNDRTYRGNTNYKGWRLEALYAFTDNITFDARVEWSKQIQKEIGGRHHFSQFRTEAIYAF